MTVADSTTDTYTMEMETRYTEVFDTRDNLRCVRLDTGEAAVVDEQGNIHLRIDICKHMEFADHGFVKVKTSVAEAMRNPALQNQLTKGVGYEGAYRIPTIYYVDIKSGHPYASLPAIERYGDFEIAYLGGYLCTRTKQYYQVKGKPDHIDIGPRGLYIEIPCHDTPDKGIIDKMIEKCSVFIRCQIRGDEDNLYWKLREFADGSVVVMDDNGDHYHVREDTETGETARQSLGKTDSEAARAMMKKELQDIEKESEARFMAERKREREEKERQRREALKDLTDAEPIMIGDKWGMRVGGRIAVPPLYRTIEPPIGHYCVMEATYGCWGVVAMDGRVEIEPRYEKVVLHEDGTAELTVFKGKVITKRLGD